MMDLGKSNLSEALAREADQADSPLETIDYDRVLARTATLRRRRRSGIAVTSSLLATAVISGAVLATSMFRSDSAPQAAAGAASTPGATPSAPLPTQSTLDDEIRILRPLRDAADTAAKVGEGSLGGIYTNVRIVAESGTVTVYLTDLSRQGDFRDAMAKHSPALDLSVVSFQQGMATRAQCTSAKQQIGIIIGTRALVTSASDCSYIQVTVPDPAAVQARLDDPSSKASGTGIPVRVVQGNPPAFAPGTITD
ncbi:hypothetical protein [Yinghuangia soli]|uniref:Uncharacterized protein n=1 Tax=Yinghuangia soli TaxID=2908204 RepID=A0AA41TXY3_9ACTN|nr:hypothetical protein [Yinghuangia soli]MCF2525811.1 hypothetical protein [Yinghuangia soli]